MVQVAYSLRPIDGGTNYFAQFSHSLPTDPNFFPIGVWLESVQTQSDINLDMAAGLNTYVAITANSNFSLVQSSGMYVIAQQNELRSNQTVINNSSTAGWLLYDEIDMQLGPGLGYTTLNTIKASLPNDGRMYYNNYGKGVLFWETDAEAAQFVNSVDVVSADAYWFTDPNISSGSEGGALLNNGNPLTASQTRLAANYGYTVDRMQELDATDGVIQPVWAFVEVGWPWTETATEGARQIQPAEIQAAVWHSIIAGARGIIYFNHSFGGPNQTQHALREPAYAAQRAAVDSTNALIEQLSPVLNSPFDDAFVTVNSSVRAMSKYYGGEHYVFAGSTVNGASTGPDTFTLAGIIGGTAVVVGENRTITITNGQFSDNFADGNAIHIYHIIADGSPTPTPGSVSINDVTISEGNSGTKVATFTVTRSGGTAAFGVNFATSNGTATVGSDYAAASNTLNFGANENTQTISVTINGDTAVEENETFNVVLSNATNGATISDSQGVGTITNDDSAATPIFTSGADTVTLPLLGGTFNALRGDDKLAYTGGPVSINGGGGNDTLDFSQFDSAVWVNLSTDGPEIRTQDRPDLSSGSWREIGDVTRVENLVGTAYSDFLQGDNRANTLQGGDGNDTLTGGGGVDTFVFDHIGTGSQPQHDVIVDFRPSVDRIDLAATPVGDFADLFTFDDRYMEQVGNDVLIHTSVSADTSILLQNVQLASLTQSDFLF